MDQILRAIDKNYSFRLFFIQSDNLVEEAKQIHGLSRSATVALGRLLTANLLLAADLKNTEDRLTLQMRGNGPGGFLVTTADGSGHVKGYADQPEAKVADKKNGEPDAGAYVGKEGTFVLIRDYGMKEPYTAHSPLVTGEIAEDIAAYYYQTENIPTAISLGVQLNEDDSVKTAGGFFLQAMPGVSEEELGKLEDFIKTLPDVTALLEVHTPEEIIRTAFAAFEMDILDTSDVSYRCDCSREKVEDALTSLHKDEIETMIKEDGGAEVVCHFCNKKYAFSETDLRQIIENRN